MYSAPQLRAARALLNWSREDLADAAGVSAIAIKKFENGFSDPRVSTLMAIRDALSRAGVIFLDEADGRGAGVAFKRGSVGKKL